MESTQKPVERQPLTVIGVFRRSTRRQRLWIALTVIVCNAWWIMSMVNASFDDVLHLPWW